MLHFAQWKNFSAPPTLQIPHPEQWYWFLSSSSNKLHSKQVYWNKTNNLHIQNVLLIVRLTFPKRIWQFWHSACTGCLVSHKVHINSVTSFLLTVWSSFSSWQNRHVYTLLQQGVYNKNYIVNNIISNGRASSKYN